MMEKIKKLGSDFVVFRMLKKNSKEFSNKFGHCSSNNLHSSKNNLEIGAPTNFKHEINVRYDESSNQFIGLPEEWKNMLERNDIK